MQTKTEIVMERLDEWVKMCGNGRYNSAAYHYNYNHTKLALAPDFAIQQERSEILEFIETILASRLNLSVLEIGLGHYGSTHFLWNMLFKKVTTIELHSERCREFGKRFSSFYGFWPEKGRSSFIFGNSNSSDCVHKAWQHRYYDVLFIDGGHDYKTVLCDWLLYSPFVKRGGLIAFHDSISAFPEQTEVPKFLIDLERGSINNTAYDLKRIEHFKNGGIAYYIK